MRTKEVTLSDIRETVRSAVLRLRDEVAFHPIASLVQGVAITDRDVNDIRNDQASIDAFLDKYMGFRYAIVQAELYETSPVVQAMYSCDLALADYVQLFEKHRRSTR